MEGEIFRRVFVPLDTPDLDQAREICRAVAGHVGGVKLGKEFFTALGPRGVASINELGLPLFLDLKFHDIPNTVAGAVRAAMALGPFMLNVHAQGGLNVHAQGGAAMMRAAAEAVAESSPAGSGNRPLVLGVTVLTSLDAADLAAVGVAASPLDQVKRLAGLAQDAGLDGVVCAGAEIEPLRVQCGAAQRVAAEMDHAG